MLRWPAGILLCLCLAGCGGLDPEQVRLCEKVISAVEGTDARFEVLEGREGKTATSVHLTYRLLDAGQDAATRWVVCEFAGRSLQSGRLNLVSVTTDRDGVLSDVRLYMLRRFFLASPEVQTGRPGRATGSAAYTAGWQRGYALQMAVNAVVPSCVYILLGCAYTLIYGLIRRINLAFGEYLMIGAYASIVAAALQLAVGVALIPVFLVIAGLAAAGYAALVGWTTERLLFRPLRASGTQAALIATVGLSIALQETVRLAQGSREYWLQPVLTERFVVHGGGGFAVSVSLAQGVIFTMTVVLGLGLVWWLRRTHQGLRLSACSDDSGLAALSGIDVNRTIAIAFVVSGGLAGIAGCVIALYYGSVSSHMGLLLGFKALVAAILGGIGSVPGAILGGVLLGAFETVWSGYLTIAYKDVAIFGVLAAVLAFRPHGLLGRSQHDVRYFGIFSARR